jgi:hypothetical protein
MKRTRGERLRNSWTTPERTSQEKCGKLPLDSQHLLALGIDKDNRVF